MYVQRKERIGCDNLSRYIELLTLTNYCMMKLDCVIKTDRVQTIMNAMNEWISWLVG